MNYAKAQTELKGKYPPNAVYFHNYMFPNSEKRSYRNKLTLVGENVKYLGVTLKDKTNRHWIVEKELSKNEYHIYEVKGECWYFKTLQPLLLSIHYGSKYCGIGEIPNKKKTTPKHQAKELRKAIITVQKPTISVSTLPVYLIKPAIICCYCETPLAHAKGHTIIPPNAKTKEHIIPKHKGGRIIKWACRECNEEKGGLILHSYIQFLNYSLDGVIDQQLYKKLQTKIKNANNLAMEISK